MKGKQWVIDRAKERTTWVGVTSFLTAVGLALSPEQAELIVAAGVAVGGAIFAVTKDDNKDRVP